MPLPAHPNVRTCTHVKVTGKTCGSPALRGEFFCYFHTRVIKGVPQRVDMRMDSMALLEDCESIQLSIMHVVDGLIKGTLDKTSARLIIQALRIAARNAKNVRFDRRDYIIDPQMVVEVPNYARQYLIEHPEIGPPLSQHGSDTPVRKPSPCSADTPTREPESTCSAVAPVREAKSAGKLEPFAPPQPAQQNAPKVSLENVTESTTAEPAAKRRKNAAHGVSRGSKADNDPASKRRKNSERDLQEKDIQRLQAAIEGAESGNWRDLRTVFEFVGIGPQLKNTPS
ncbi:MAG TPA: hypothetical protein VGP35_02445 [Terriglobales bacterium]|jgi:hypothetical protein|nr:hypothetical protein [Terriglobales bacterium]